MMMNCGCGPRQGRKPQRGWQGHNAPAQGWNQGEWAPAIDVKEDAQAYYLSADLPGMSREDIKLELEEGQLSLSAERKLQESGEGESWRWVGRRYGSFSRRIRLPRTVNADSISAEYKDGVLHVTLPKSEDVKARQVSIN
jgi:HSP20 family protein